MYNRNLLNDILISSIIERYNDNIDRKKYFVHFMSKIVGLIWYFSQMHIDRIDTIELSEAIYLSCLAAFAG
jgi:hypothetical protein